MPYIILVVHTQEAQKISGALSGHLDLPLCLLVMDHESRIRETDTDLRDCVVEKKSFTSYNDHATDETTKQDGTSLCGPFEDLLTTEKRRKLK